MIKVAALYVDTTSGPYPSLPGVECYGQASRNGKQQGLFGVPDRDARSYAGPHPVVAHPPCGPWGRFWWNYKGGEGDKSCGPTAIEQARAFGGVVEHPSESHLWQHMRLPKPGEAPDKHGGRTFEVEQVDWGHMARKRTWLYVVGSDSLPAMPAKREPSHVMVRLLRNGNDLPEVPKRLRHLTPKPFAEWLVTLARMTQASDLARLRAAMAGARKALTTGAAGFDLGKR